MANRDDDDKIISLEDRRKKNVWKITYAVKPKSKRIWKKMSSDKVVFWIKFAAYILLVSYVLNQCGF